MSTISEELNAEVNETIELNEEKRKNQTKIKRQCEKLRKLSGFWYFVTKLMM